MVTRDYSNINWSEHFYVNTESPSGLSRLKPVYLGNTSVIKYPIGSPVGYSSSKGKLQAWQTDLDSKSYYVHRIIWCLVYGSIDSSLVIDHINGDPTDNSISNLRLVTFTTNLQNKTLYRANTSGITGVSKYSNRGTIIWVAEWTENCIRKSKSFSTSKYGDNGAFKMACEHRTEQIKKLNNNGQSYTKRHGKCAIIK